MKLRLTPRALAEAKRKKSWWLENRAAAPDLFEGEFNATLRSILATPTLGTLYRSPFELVIRRVLMARTKNHVYYTVADEEIVILSVWGASRGRHPNI